MFTPFPRIEPWVTLDRPLGANFLAVFPGLFRASVSRRDWCSNSKCSYRTTDQPWRCHGRSRQIWLQLPSCCSDHSFRATDLHRIATSDFIPRSEERRVVEE